MQSQLHSLLLSLRFFFLHLDIFKINKLWNAKSFCSVLHCAKVFILYKCVVCGVFYSLQSKKVSLESAFNDTQRWEHSIEGYFKRCPIGKVNMTWKNNEDCRALHWMQECRSRKTLETCGTGALQDPKCMPLLQTRVRNSFSLCASWKNHSCCRRARRLNVSLNWEQLGTWFK